MPTVHGVNASPFVRKVRVALAEKRVAYDLEPVMPMGVSDEFKKISPLGKIPVYTDGDYSLPDSSCIIAYLDRVHPEPPLYPRDAKEFGRALFYEEYGDTKLVDVIGKIFFQRVVVKHVMRGRPDESAVKEALEDLLPPVLDYLDGEVGGGEGIVGGRFSIADIGLGSPFAGLMHAGEKIDAARWPRLAAYVERIHSRPSFKTLIEEEKASLAANS